MTGRHPAAMRSPAPPLPAEQPPLGQSPGDPPPRRSARANLLVLLAGSGLLLAAVAMVVQLTTNRSRDAVVDAEVIDLNTPIGGEVRRLLVDVGRAVNRGEKLALVENLRASDGDLRQVQTALATARAQLDKTERELALTTSQEQTFAADALAQRQLELARDAHRLEELQALRRREQEEVAFSRRDLQRQQDLYRVGAVAETVVDRARTSLQKNREQLQALDAQLQAQQRLLEADRRDLTLTRTRSNIDPMPRLQEARLKRQQLESTRLAQQRQVAGLEGQLASSSRLYANNRRAWLVAPRPAVVWALMARSGDDLRPHQKVLQLVDCQRRWVTTTVSERNLKRLQIGSPAKIDLIGESLDLNGTVELIRSGMGRLNPPDGEPSPLPLNQTPESQVRVRILNDVPAPPRKLCFVGYGARVVFP